MVVECTGEFVSKDCVLSLAKHKDKDSNISYSIEIEYNSMVTARKSKSIKDESIAKIIYKNKDESIAKIIYKKLKEYIKQHGIPSNVEFDTFISSRL